jgi:glutamine amidotransferase
MNANSPTDLTFSFSGFAPRGGRTDQHADGWGVAFFEGDGVRAFIDQASAACSPIAKLLCDYPIRSENVIAHIRKATQGEVSLRNCHPFTRELWGRYWVFAHNGDLGSFRPRLHAHFRPVGTTDSEWLFCWIMQELWKSHANLPSVPELTQTLAELCDQVRAEVARLPNAKASFNFLLSNGQALWAHCSTELWFIERAHPFGHAKLVDEELSIDFAQHTQPSDKVSVVVTKPLTDNETWQRMAPGELKVFQDGAAQATQLR